jgi:hypothetical protein
MATAANSLLLIRRNEGSGWIAQIVGPVQSQRIVTDYEASVLCAAWQSPLPPPSEHQIHDVGLR